MKTYFIAMGPNVWARSEQQPQAIRAMRKLADRLKGEPCPTIVYKIVQSDEGEKPVIDSMGWIRHAADATVETVLKDKEHTG